MSVQHDRFPLIDAQNRRLQVSDDVTVRAIQRGRLSPDEPVFLLVHGLASNARMWDGVGTVLENRGYSSVAVDLRGHGLSDKPDIGYDFDTVSADLTRVLDALGLDQAIVVGQSWGGNVAIHSVCHHSERFTSAVAVDGGFIELSRSFPEWDDCAKSMRPPHLAGTRAGRLESAIRSMNADWPESGIIGALSNFHLHDDGTVSPHLTYERHMKILHELWKHRPSVLFPQISRPVLFLPADSGDVAWTQSKERAIEEALALLPKGDSRWFRPAHHDLHAQFPERTAQTLIDAHESGFLQ